MKGPLSDKLRVHHILDAIAEVETYIDGVTEDEFIGNSQKRFATIKQIEIVGEACTRISPAVRQAHPEIPWHQIIGFRHISIHEYHTVSMHVVWDIAANNLPELKEQMKNILEGLS